MTKPLRTTTVTVVVESNDASRDQEIVDLAVRLGNALERRGRTALVLVTSSWKTTPAAPVPDGTYDALADEALKKATSATKTAGAAPTTSTDKPEGT